MLLLLLLFLQLLVLEEPAELLLQELQGQMLLLVAVCKFHCPSASA
jgi:hypothetical protein